MSKKLVAICGSDFHLHNWAKFNEGNNRTLVTLEIIEMLLKRSIKENVPLLVPGDWVHTPKAIDNEVLGMLLYSLKTFEKAQIYSTSGNHDQSQKNTIIKDIKGKIKSHTSPSYVKSLSYVFNNFNCIDNSVIDCGSFLVCGLPYFSKNAGLEYARDKLIERIENFKGKDKPKILLIHTDLHGAKDTDGREVKEVENIPTNMDDFFEYFDLVVSGHIHQHQKFSDKIWMVGAPNQQRLTDINSKQGYLEIYLIDKKKFKVKFIELPNVPKFKLIYEDEVMPEDNNYYIVIPRPKEKGVDGKKLMVKNFSKGTNINSLIDQYFEAIGNKDESTKAVLNTIIREANEW